MKEYRPLTYPEIDIIFDELTKEGWNPLDIARYEKTISSMAKTLDVPVMRLYESQDMLSYKDKHIIMDVLKL